jgi:cytochrome c-type biogenesis protein CcmF
MYLSNPDFIPNNGNGLNPLLQNYWMVIHPPTLFLGFALCQIPFAYAIAGLLTGEHLLWIKKSFTWSLVTAAILGIGIMMGAFWAYETLNFGGYWNWDPVENAVFVPWIILVALIHTFTLNEKRGTAIGISYILAISVFVLVLYSTFLTRSGILGNASVHSFTDLGLSGQLLVFLLLFLVGSIFLLIKKWKTIPKSENEVQVYSREFWIFSGIVVFAFSCFQVLLATSFPVINKVGTLMGFNPNLAPPADQVKFYGNFQIWAGIFIALVGGVAQYIWWTKIELKNLFTKVLIGTSILLVFFALGYIIILLMDSNDGIYQRIVFENDSEKNRGYLLRVVSYILLFATSCFGLIISGLSLYKVRKSFWKLSGGALAHIGVALMLLGFLFSTGYSSIVSKNNEGIISEEFTTAQNKENVVLWRHTSHNLGDYSLTYSGQFYQPRNSNQYINLQDLQLTDSIGMGLVKNKIENYKIGDTVFFAEENVFYKIDYKSADGEQFSIYPRVQKNEKMGGILPSPDVKRFFSDDIYSYVASVPTEGDKWSDTTYKVVGHGDTIIINDYIGVLDTSYKVTHINGVDASKFYGKAVIPVCLEFKFQGKNGKNFTMKPTFIVKEDFSQWAHFNEVSDDLAISMFIKKLPNAEGVCEIGINTSAVDYVIFHAERKPLINLVWAGTLLTALGFVIAGFRRRSSVTE